jgi:transportin-1
MMPNLEDRIRTFAGYLLKNNARLVIKLTPQTLEFVQTCILRAFSEGGAMVRNAAGQDIVAVLATLSPRHWPQALTALVSMLDSDTIDQQEVGVLSNSVLLCNN